MLEAKNLTKKYEDVIAVDNVSLAIEKGGASFGIFFIYQRRNPRVC
jgi:ABC-type multidrug transport system ATPase subunit